ncbi:hypothetical protein ACFS5L_13495 [Streptomyces phyllanthi]|uniref:Uncharacterized protein n=1 Tax=Streptomyces phyllanthi TaxID=1803180 RepID=A0A5N8WFC5_9ACTN|nr:hypothetical protein [Streptomyces phyllanthi]MPY45949.1 hypothetical protein [Streptomyces phyllanthi]
MSDSVPEARPPQEAVVPEPGSPAGPGPGFQAEPEFRAEPEPEYDPAAPAPLGVPRTPTGNADVDASLDRLADTDHLAPDGHVEVYEDVHRGLRDALTALDARPGPPAPSPSYRPSYQHRS